MVIRNIAFEPENGGRSRRASARRQIRFFVPSPDALVTKFDPYITNAIPDSRHSYRLVAS